MNGDPRQAKGADSDLHELLRQVSGSAPAARSGASPSTPVAAGQAADDLHALLKGGQGAGNAVRPQEVRRDTRAPESLEAVLRASTGAPGAGQAHPPPRTAVSPTAAPALDQALRALHGQTRGTATPGPRANAAKAAHANPLDLGQALRDQSATGSARVVEAKDDVLTSRWFIGTVGTLGLCILLGAALWWHQRPSAGPADTLRTLAQAVEQSRKTNHGQLPAQLSKLEGFPRDAVEWPVQYWAARDAAGRVEIVWIPQGGGHYSIAYRHGNTIWLYMDREGKPRQTGQ